MRTEAHAVGDQGIRTYSATGVDTVLVVFPELLGGSLTEGALVERWDDARRSRSGAATVGAIGSSTGPTSSHGVMGTV
jgi:hypothetical protein